ncbi:hypothetical protein GGX14DRAFT_657791 [Mycena pura]|uniref:Uncharacterized protein n=1 Tax=Mycena pura TaxID=153505 RepID=A0AAD6YLY0_9AGAR|nr:hypothetical protein GGX14DRAFT_657791 [Mycena pura]
MDPSAAISVSVSAMAPDTSTALRFLSLAAGPKHGIVSAMAPQLGRPLGFKLATWARPAYCNSAMIPRFGHPRLLALSPYTSHPLACFRAGHWTAWTTAAASIFIQVEYLSLLWLAHDTTFDTRNGARSGPRRTRSLPPTPCEKVVSFHSL